MILQSTLSTRGLTPPLGEPHTHISTTVSMVLLVGIFFLAVMDCVFGRSLPPLPMKDGCYQVSPEVMILRTEGDAVMISFPMFMSVLKKRKIAPATAKYQITKDNGAEGVAYDGEGRVQQHDRQLWFLPAHALDSGEYTCTYRNETYCVKGSITLQVYTSSSADVQKLSYHINVTVGDKLKFKCPDLSDFSRTGGLTKWYKNSSLTSDQQKETGLSLWGTGDLKIPEVKSSHAGLYVCQLRVLINNQQYKVSRSVQLHVQGLDPVIDTTVPRTSDQEPFSIHSSLPTPVVHPPVIVSPINGTVFESLHGSGLELFCKVLTDCPAAESTLVSWWVNGKSVEASYLDGRALQGGRRISPVSDGCQIELRLIVVALTEEDVKTELKCITENRGGRQEVVVQLQLEDSTSTWIVVAAVAVSCFLTVVSVFLVVLFKPKKKKNMDYFLARQNSTF